MSQGRRVASSSGPAGLVPPQTGAADRVAVTLSSTRREEGIFISPPVQDRVRGPGGVLPLRVRLLRETLPTFILVSSIILAWEVAVSVAGWPSYLLPRPGAIFQRLAADPGFFVAQGGVTLAEALVGLAVGAGGAFIIGAAMA